MRIYHISDLHFGLHCLNPLQLFTKRLLGSLNYFIKRRFAHSKDLCDEFITSINPKQGDIVLISGDFTTTSQRREYQMGIKFIQALSEKGLLVYAIPGNHDAYTRYTVHKDAFYNHFCGLLPFKGEFELDLRKDKVAAHRLENHQWLVLLDCSTYTGYLKSSGLFSKKIEEKLIIALSKIPSQDSIYLSCHYPFFQHEAPRRRLERGKNLQALLEKHPNVQLYLHGHTHRHSLADLRENGLPLISDAGSLSIKKRATYNLIDIQDHKIEFQVHRYNNHQWEQESVHAFKTNTK
ncbi:MAG: metallophosphoesterase [Rhabdochlamydiaceae bacterium]|nr:metallophosphoesterase [Candidatus Amphrikana amoebophyrae]